MLDQKQRDAITEIVNIGVGKGSATLSSMIDSEIILNVPYVNVISFEELLKEFDEISSQKIHAIELKFHGEFEGISNIILPSKSANRLASVVTQEPEDSESFKEMKNGILIELGNIILNAVMGAFGNILDVPFEYKTPQSFEGKIHRLYEKLDKNKYTQILLCKTNFTIKGKAIEGEILIIYEINSFNKLKGLLDTMIN